MEELRNELNLVIDVASNIYGVHKRICERMDITMQSLNMIRNGKRLIKDKPLNRAKLRLLRMAYRKEIKQHGAVMDAFARKIEVIL